MPAIQDYAFIEKYVLLKFLIPPVGELTPKLGSFGTAVQHVIAGLFFSVTQWTSVIICYTGTEQADSVRRHIMNYFILKRD